MKWRYAIITLIVLSLATVRLAVGVPLTQAPSVTYSGQVDIAPGLDGKLLVLIDEGTASQPGDGLVEQAFRLQDAPSLAYSGNAIVTYTRGRLTVQVATDVGWVFNVAGRDLPPPDLALTAYTITGISHLWGASIHQSPATLFSSLSSGNCSPAGVQSPSAQTSVRSFGTVALADGDPSCKNCEAGGPGMPTCTINCGNGSSCEADCDSTSFACCNCQSPCGCCSKNSGSHH